MSVVDIWNRHDTLSFEVFPPKTDVGMADLCGRDGVLERLYTLLPDNISCTYSVGGTDAGKNLAVLDKVVSDGRTAAMTHFTCAGNTRQSAAAQLRTCLERGIDRVLALRGDLPAGSIGTGSDLRCAGDLVTLIRQEFGDRFTIAVAGAPEGHPGCRSLEADIDALKRKQDSGADYIITQLCWDMDTFRYWLDAIRAAGIRLPVDVTVMPILDQAETIHTLSQNGSVMPRPLCELISKNWILPNPFVKDSFDADAERKRADFRKAGLEYTVNQIHEYRRCGAGGIHLLTRNRFEDAALIVRESGLLKELNVEN